MRASVRRIQLTVGLGFIAMIVGSIVAAPLHIRMGPRLAAMGSEVMSFVVFAAVARLWILAALPLLCYAVARVIDVRPVPTAVGAALTGEFIGLAIDALSGGIGALLDQPLFLAMRLVTAVIGVALSVFAIKSARAHLKAAQETAQKAAVDRKGEYDEFLKEAQRLADLKDKPVAPDAAPADAQPKPPETPPTT